MDRLSSGACVAPHDDARRLFAAHGLARSLGLAAAPTFAFMALLNCVGESPMASLCGPAGSAPANGMAVMYLLMSVFHAPSWLRRIGTSMH